MIKKLSCNKNTLSRLAQIEKNNFVGEAWNEKMLGEMFANAACGVFGIIQGGDILGYCALYIVDKEGEIANIVVDKPFRKQGLGRQMMDFMMGLFRKKGVQTVFLEVNTANGAAINMYYGYGFKIISKRKDYYPKDNEHKSSDAFVMAKNL